VATATALVLLWRLLGERMREGSRTPARAGLVLLVAAALLPPAVLQEQEVFTQVRIDTGASVLAREPLGTWLSSVGGPGASVAMLDVGAVAYGNALRVIDTGGLTDARIARVINASRGTYQGHLFFPDNAGCREIARVVLGDKPSFVVLRLNGELPWILEERLRGEDGRPLPLRAAYQQDRALFEAPNFADEYEFLCGQPSDPSTEGWIWHYNVFVRKGLPLARRPHPDAQGATRCF
jgi:hypothetical protein